MFIFILLFLAVLHREVFLVDFSPSSLNLAGNVVAVTAGTALFVCWSRFSISFDNGFQSFLLALGVETIHRLIDAGMKVVDTSVACSLSVDFRRSWLSGCMLASSVTIFGGPWVEDVGVHGVIGSARYSESGNSFLFGSGSNSHFLQKECSSGFAIHLE